MIKKRKIFIDKPVAIKTILCFTSLSNNAKVQLNNIFRI